MTDALLSVVVPVYNVEPYIRRCLDSICSQTYGNLEIILVDDGSTDQSGSICDGYAEKDRRIKTIHKKNGGLVSARKAGVSIAKGKYLAHVDSDDWIEPNMYEEMLKIISGNDCEIVTSGCFRNYEKGSELREIDAFAQGMYKKGALHGNPYGVCFTEKFGEFAIHASVWNKIYLTEFARPFFQNLPDGLCIGEDAAVVYPMLYKADRFFISHDCFYHYCFRTDSITRILSDENVASIKKLYGYYRRYFKDDRNILGQLCRYIFFMILTLKPELLLSGSSGRLEYKYFKNLFEDEKIILYGAGKFGAGLHGVLKKHHHVAAWLDREPNKENGVEEIKAIESIPKDSYDKVVLGAINWTVKESMIHTLHSYGISDDRIAYVDDANLSLEDVERICGS